MTMKIWAQREHRPASKGKDFMKHLGPLTIIGLLVVGLPWATGAQTTNVGTSAEKAPVVSAPIPARASLYRSMNSLDNTRELGIGDVLSYRVIEDREDPKALIISDAGELEVPYLGRAKAADKTCQQLAQEIKVALEKELYYQATVIIAVDQLNKKRGTVYLVGQVRQSGPQEIPSDEVFTLSKAILKAGGFGDFADKKHVKLTRKAEPGKEQPRIFEVDVSEILEKGRMEKDLKLEPGDLIYVPGRLLNF